MAKQPTYSDADLAMLSEEERAGLLDPDLVDDIDDADDTNDAADQDAAKAEADAAAAKAASDEAAKKAADDEAAKRVADEAAAKAAADAAAAGKEPEKVEKPAGSDADKGKDAGWTPPTFQPPENAQARLDAIEKQKDDLHQLFDDGELNSRELREKLKPLESDAQRIRDDALKASFSLDWSKDNYFKNTVPAFLSKHSEYEAGSPMFNALDLEMKKLQGQNPERAFDPTLLEEAHKTVREGTLRALGIDPATLEKKPSPKTETPKRVIPPTIGAIPAADISETGTISKFEALDKMTGEKYETELAKLSEADREAYLSGG
jgi:hypothetical protein